MESSPGRAMLDEGYCKLPSDKYDRRNNDEKLKCKSTTRGVRECQMHQKTRNKRSGERREGRCGK